MYMYWPQEGDRPTKNFGDALNPAIGKFFSGEQIINISSCETNDDVYLVCGSSLSFATVPTIVWGSAILTPRFKLQNVPKKIFAVRGPKTRKWLLDRKIKCPDIYGDPGLLCPMMFQAQQKKKYPLGIIPHVVDKHQIKEWELPENIKFIDIEGDFQTVVDEVNQCENIISSSLHGLILADTYHIPSLWIVVSGIPTAKGKVFKYHDYMLSVGLAPYAPYNLSKDRLQNTRKLIKMCRNVDIQIDLKKLVDVCPFNKMGRRW